MSTSSVVSSASALCGTQDGMCSTSPARDVDRLGLVLAEREAQRAFEDVGQLLVLVRVARHDAALLQEDLGEHHPLGRDQPARQGRPSAAPSACRPSGSASPSARSHERPEARDPVVDLLFVDEAEGEAKAVRAPAVREEERARERRRHPARPPAPRARRRRPPGSVSQEKKPPRGVVHRADSGIERSSAASIRSHLRR